MNILSELWSVRPLRLIVIMMILSGIFVPGTIGTAIVVSCLSVFAVFFIILRMPRKTHYWMTKNKLTRTVADLALTALALGVLGGGTGSQLMIISGVITAILFSCVLERWAVQLHEENLLVKQPVLQA